MPSNLQGAVFDYGSTLIWFDTSTDHLRPIAHAALYQALIAEGIALDEKSFLRRFARNFDQNDRKRGKNHIETTTISVLRKTLIQERKDPPRIETLRRLLRSMYEVYETHWQLFPQTHLALRELQAMGLRLALLSNAADNENVRQMLKNHGLEEFFDPIVVSAAIGIRKPDARPFRMILEAWRLSAKQVVMVGDQLGADILGAQSVGMRNIWLRTEKDSPSNTVHLGKIVPEAEADQIGQVPGILRRWILENEA